MSDIELPMSIGSALTFKIAANDTDDHRIVNPIMCLADIFPSPVLLRLDRLQESSVSQKREVNLDVPNYFASCIQEVRQERLRPDSRQIGRSNHETVEELYLR
jgi:hypothetical protein